MTCSGFTHGTGSQMCVGDTPQARGHECQHIGTEWLAYLGHHFSLWNSWHIHHPLWVHGQSVMVHKAHRYGPERKNVSTFFPSNLMSQITKPMFLRVFVYCCDQLSVPVHYCFLLMCSGEGQSLLILRNQCTVHDHRLLQHTMQAETRPEQRAPFRVYKDKGINREQVIFFFVHCQKKQGLLEKETSILYYLCPPGIREVCHQK